ncbi:MAG: DUF2517 family protein [Gammaproteobacteria bacterium]|nr:DUF2517 family protein [Gammaproteobacteria bacterium]
MYQSYAPWVVLVRRLFAVVVGCIAFPFAIWRADRARLYSYLHRYWLKTSEQPVWMAENERSVRELF